VYVTGNVTIPHWSDRRERKRADSQDPAVKERRAHRFDIIDEIAPQPGEGVILKSGPSAFWGTPLAAHLQYHGVDTVIACGESTSGCVRASVVDGCAARFRMMVVEECVWDRHETAHAMNLFDMNQKYADVVSLDETLEWLGEWRANKATAASGR
jgi:nicotinamidase-related amidase